MGKGLSWSVADMQLLGEDMASGKTLYAIYRGRGWPYLSVKQMAARLKEGDLDANIKMHCGPKRKITKEDKKNIEQRIQEVPETSVKQIQHWFVTEIREDGVSGDHANVHEDGCQTAQKDEGAFPLGCAQGQAPELVLGHEAQDWGWCPPRHVRAAAA